MRLNRIPGAAAAAACACAVLAGCANPPAPGEAPAGAGTTAGAPTGVHAVGDKAIPGAVLAGDRGHHGAVAWSLNPQGVWLSRDAGRSYTQLTLPAGVPAASVVAVDGTTGGHTWIASEGAGPAVRVYRQQNTGGAWSNGTQLSPAWPTGLGGEENAPPTQVTLTHGRAASEVTVVAELQLSHDKSIPAIFTSTDGAATFARHSVAMSDPISTPWHSSAFDGATGIAVTGGRANQLFHTPDGGTTWSASTISGLAPGSAFQLGTPVTTADGYLVPATAASASGSTLTLLRSTDGGATFTTAGPPAAISHADTPGETPVAYAAGTWWATDGAVVIRSSDDGQSWTSQQAPTLPVGVTTLDASSSTDATATIVQTSCASGKTQCTATTIVESTSDGGATWQRV